MTDKIKRKNRKRNNSINRRRKGALERRITQLSKSEDNSRTAAELSALKWVVNVVIPEWMAEDPVVEVLWGGDPFVKKAYVEDIEAMVGQMVYWRETDLSRPRACRVVGARFISEIDAENVVQLWLIPSDDPVPDDAKIVNGMRRKQSEDSDG